MSEEKEMDKVSVEMIDKKHCCKKWAKFALILIAVFLGAYMAAYTIMDKVFMMKYVYPHKHHTMQNMEPFQIPRDVDRLIRMDDKIMKNMGNDAIEQSPAILKYSDDDEAYKIVVNLKHFNDDPNKINIEAQPTMVTISGKNYIEKKKSEKQYLFTQTFMFDKKIDVNKITKSFNKHKLVITLPILDD